MQIAGWELYLGIILGLSSIVVFSLNKKNGALFLLAAGAFFIRLHMAHIDAFLHDWDEKFHALVARNMMEDPFRPVLKNGMITPYDYKAWCCNYIWVHKQPLFMWQMALSMKIFGVSEYAIRYPDVLMGTLMVLMVFRTGKLLADNDTIGFMAAMFMCCSNYQLELLSGYYGMDHNDLAFGFYVLASIWAYAEYIKSGKFKWVVWIGVFAGCAVLNKWLTGLLVFAGWGVNILTNIRNKDSRKELLHILIAIGVCLIIFLPWQLYILYAFPVEAKHELTYNSKHLFEIVEGHKGDGWFYWNNFPLYVNVDLWKIFPVGMLFVFAIRKYRNRYGICLVTILLTAYCFFSYVVASKLQSYMYVIVPLIFIFMAVGIGTLLKWIKVPVFLQVALAGYFCFLLLNMGSLLRNHHPDDIYRNVKAHNTQVYKQLKSSMPPDIKVVTNLSTFADIECMFYNKGITAYHYYPTPEEFAMMQKMHLRVAAFKDHGEFYVPDYMLAEQPNVYIIRKELR